MEADAMLVMEQEVRNLIRRAQSGDEQAFDHLLRAYSRRLHRLALRYTASGAEWADLLQLARLGFWEAVLQYDTTHYAPFWAFARVVVERSIHDAIRAGSLRRIPAVHFEDPISPDDPDDDERTLSDVLHDSSAIDPAQYVAAQDEAEALLRRVQSLLSPREWRVFVMYVHGHSYADIASSCQCTRRGVDSTLMRVRLKLRQLRASTDALRCMVGML